MLGGNHFKKKINKKIRKQARKEEEAHGGKKAPPASPAAAGRNPHGAGQQTAVPAFAKSKNQSYLKGPIVSHPDVQFAHDSHNTPLPSRGRGRGRGGFTPAPPPERREDEPLPQSASSRAQKKRFSRASGDDLLDQFKAKLSGSTFRLLNEQIYNSSNSFAEQLMRDTTTFGDYHQGYRWQLSQWPIDPNQLFIDSILENKHGRFPQNRSKAVAGPAPTNWVIADMGCGDAKVAQALVPKGYTVHSLDFAPTPENKPFLTLANCAKAPLVSGSVDVCIFSLSLMATDWFDCILEAHRILKPKKLLKIVEVRSRLPNARIFAELIAGVGFTCEWYDVVGNYFVAFDFVRNEVHANGAFAQPAHRPGDVLLPSLYKKR